MLDVTIGLNSKQQEAVLETEIPILIVAGAGSGKTKVITHKIAHLLINKNYRPDTILAITFTNKAANEMKQRTANLIHQHGMDKINMNSFWISTFHSACVRILRRDIHHLGFKQNFSIYDTQDTQRLLKQIITEKKLDLPSNSIASIVSYISLCKNQFLMPSDVMEQAKNEANRFKEQSGMIYEAYEKALFANNALDFDNLILKTIQLLKENPVVLRWYQEKFRYLLIDELQDTNTPQYDLVHMLAKHYKHISVVGDDDQSIYSWRGADISNIKKFKTDFNPHHIIKLEQNYRSTNTILKASHGLISKSQSRMEKKLWSNKEEGQPLMFYRSYTDRSESNWLVNQIMQLYDKNVPLNEIAIFYRMHHQSRIIEETLRKNGLNYRILGGIQFYLRKEIKDILAYMVLLINPNDFIAMQRAINTPRRGIGTKTLQTIQSVCNEFQLNFEQSAKLVIDEGLIRSNTRKQIIHFLDWLKELKKIASKTKPTELAQQIIDDIGYYEFIKQNETNYEDKIANIQELLRSIAEFEQTHPEPSLENYLTQVSLSNNLDLSLQTDKKQDHQNECVQMMSLHHSKGLEFSYVFITGLSEGLLPHERSLQKSNELEEERRLLYVGITRAKHQCYLSAAKQVFQFGHILSYEISRFINDIPSNLINIEIEANQDTWDYKLKPTITEISNPILKNNPKSTTYINTNNTNYIQKPEEIEMNDYVHHPKYGHCQIVEIKNSSYILPSVIVRLSDNRKLTLILKYAKLSKVDPS